MSAIYKLSISGVRSFDARQPETIEFGKPLTLIVGPNGTGKTTIIECLKYATTGDLPPNSKGGAFVHDPGMYGEKEVKAEVKLAFQSLSGNSMVCTRNMQVISKKGAVANTFKTLEGQLLQMNRGERTTISTKCAELDDLVPKNLGTPKPILDYVIFCHQEDSLWPLSEPSILKKRFDEIFEALKFTKALDNLKVIRKEMAIEIKLLDQSVKHLKLDKDRAQRTREKLEKSNELITRFNDETAILEDEIAEVTRQSDELFKSNQEFQEVLSKLESMKHEERSVNEQIERLQESCQLLADDDDQLRYKMTNFQNLIKESTARVEELKSSVRQLQNELRSVRDEHSLLVGEEGQLKSKENEYEMNLMTRDDLAEKAQNDFDAPITDDFREIQEHLKASVVTSQNELDTLEKSVQKQEQTLQNAIHEVSDSRLKELQHKQYAMTDITNLESEIKSIQSRVNSLNVHEGNLEYEKSSLEGLEEKLKNLKKNKAVETMNQEIRAKNVEVVTIENELEAVTQNISLTHKHSDAHAKISLLTDELKFKEKAHSKLKESSMESFQTAGIDMGKIMDDYSSKVSSQKSQLEEKKHQMTQLEKRVAETSTNLNYHQVSLGKLTTSMNASLEKFRTELEEEEVDEYPEILASAEEDYKVALENLKMSTTTLQFNKKALEVAETTDCCYLCSRKFEDRPVLQTFITELKRKTDGQADRELQSQLNEAKNYLSKVRSLGGDVETVTSTRSTIQESKETVVNLTDTLKSLQAELSAVQTDVTSLRDQVSELENMRNAVNEIVRLESDIDALKTQLDTKQQELSDHGFSARSLEELQADSRSMSDNLKTLRKGITTLQEEKEGLQRELTMLEGNVKDKRLMISNMERSVIERENLLRSIDDDKKKTAGLQEIVTKADEVVAKLDDQMQILNQEFESVKKENFTRVKEAREKVKIAIDFYDEVKSLNKKIEEYVSSGATKLKQCQKRIVETRTFITELEEKIATTSATVNEEELRLADSASEERNLRANLDLRHLGARLEHIQQQIDAVDVSNAEAEREKYQEMSNHLRQQYTNLRAELAGKRGEIRQIEDQSRQLNRELETEFKDVERNYKEEWTKLQTRTVVNDDLDTYSKALDSAIMSYHALKMKEINRIIDELWKTTYSGSDVDTIQIKSEQSGKGNKSYNYRVVMVKQDAVLDMRGRCSAGQKVLAAIIIRLALSECFGTNCGVIALDEPTTNLDADNIESLAHSLSRIIETRKSQKNFQLIVITHDEKFLNSMSAAKYTDHFFRLRRDESQNSQIEWVDITRVVE